MICPWFDTEFFEFLRRSVMSCFSSCFGFKEQGDRHPHLVSEAPPTKSREAVVPHERNKLGSLLLSEEKDGSPCKEKQTHIQGSPQPDFDVRGLKQEAKFLKACGVLPETPAEIRKALKKLKDSPHNENSESLKFHSWLPNTSMQKLIIEPDQPPTPVKLCEEWVTKSCSLEHTPRSCLTGEQSTARISTSLSEDTVTGSVSSGNLVRTNKPTASFVSPRPLAASVQSKNKSVRFECNSDLSSISSKSSSSEASGRNIKQFESACNESVLKPSPYPTPLKLTDEMQTPGTVFPTYVGNGKNPRIRTQYVYSVLNPVENFSQWKLLKEEEPSSNLLSTQPMESLEQDDKVITDSEMRLGESSVQKELKVEESLSSWLKPPPTNQDSIIQRVGFASSENTYYSKTPGDRPILGMVAAHWNEAEPSPSSLKWWDGNGIPNSTTKYKEDQKVSWHATPFEERLEKALSEETLISQRKRVSGTPPMDLNEGDECDTARSQLQSSTHFSSVASF